MNRSSTRIRRLLALVALLAVVSAACGSDDAETAADAAPDDEATQPADSGDAADDEAAEPAESTEDDDTAEVPAAFPVTIEHKYGTTTIESEPQRVVTVGFTEHDFVLALGVTPVAVRDWYGDQPFATWPWAVDELGDAEPTVLASTALNFEEIAALDPDVILGISSGMTDEEYATLSAIAPTVAQPGDYIDYGTPWEVQTRLIGEALGRSDEAETVIADTEQLVAAARADHPGFEGATATVAFYFPPNLGGYASSDSRAQLMVDLGFVIPADYDELAGDDFYFYISPEETAMLDADVIVWLASTDAEVTAVRDLPLRPTLTAFADGREVLADPLLSGALGHSSPLSIEYAIDELVPELALAVDGDTATVVPSASAIDPDAADGGGELGPDEQAVAQVWATVFDSESAFADKAAHLENADELAETIDAYAQAGSGMGGIALEPTGVVVDGDTATVTYDVLFGGTAAYTALTGEITRLDGTWTVGRDEFCTFMASARTPCP